MKTVFMDGRKYVVNVSEQAYKDLQHDILEAPESDRLSYTYNVYGEIYAGGLCMDLLLMENEESYVPKLLPYINQCTVLLNYPVDQEVNPYMHLFGMDEERKPFTWKTGPAQKNESCSYCGAVKASAAIGCNTVA